MADPAVTPAAVADRPLTLEEKKAAARARARAARQAEQPPARMRRRTPSGRPCSFAAWRM